MCALSVNVQKMTYGTAAEIFIRADVVGAIGAFGTNGSKVIGKCLIYWLGAIGAIGAIDRKTSKGVKVPLVPVVYKTGTNGTGVYGSC